MPRRLVFGVAGGDLFFHILPLTPQRFDFLYLFRRVAALFLQSLFQRRQFIRLLLPTFEQSLLPGGQRRSFVSNLRQSTLALVLIILLCFVPRRLQLALRQHLSAARATFVGRQTQFGGLHLVPQPTLFRQLPGQFRRLRRQFVQPRPAIRMPLHCLPMNFLPVFQLQQAGRQLLQPQLRSGRQRRHTHFLQPGFGFRQFLSHLLFLFAELLQSQRGRLRQAAARFVQPHRDRFQLLVHQRFADGNQLAALFQAASSQQRRHGLQASVGGDHLRIGRFAAQLQQNAAPLLPGQFGGKIAGVDE